MEDSFKNFSRDDYVNGACLTLENAQKHSNAATLLSAHGSYGMAISHLILGAEEFIKSFILLSLSGDKQFIEDSEKIELFKNHKFKHKHIALFLKSISDSQASNFEEELSDLIFHGKPFSSKYSLDGHYIRNVFNLVSIKDSTFKNLEEWLRTANDAKNNGFYLGIGDNWKSPGVYTKNDYDKCFDFVEIIKKAIEPLFEMPLTDDDFIEYLNREAL